MNTLLLARRSATTRHRWIGILTAVLVVGSLGLAVTPGTSAAAATDLRFDFESDDVGSIPAGCETLDGYAAASVSDERASAGERSLRLNDTSAENPVGVSCATESQQGAYLSFQVSPQSLAGFTFDVIGESLIPTGQPANSLFRLAVRDDGSVEWFEQWSGRWYEMAPASSVPLDEWTHIEVAVPSDHAAARVSVGGEYVGSAAPTIGNNTSQHNEVLSVTGLAFTTGAAGDDATSDDVFVDDIVFGTPDST
ncbi:MAG: hypothetical protein ACTH2J_02335, partial [Candidatus Microbacterium stercoravium]